MGFGRFEIGDSMWYDNTALLVYINIVYFFMIFIAHAMYMAIVLHTYYSTMKDHGYACGLYKHNHNLLGIFFIKLKK